MKVTEIRQAPIQAIDVKSFKPDVIAKAKPEKAIADKIDLSSDSVNWQKDILLSALDMLEDKISVDSDYPLDRVENKPIETFDEALIELNFLKSAKFRNEASAAQANISAADILSLFIEEAA